ncbi:AMP-dependent synthetase/ligase [Demequina lignilytica]|uniref:Acyl-CoA synthetase n=1 Tax=Demequina lignilytica TaxID=3051663 RepID=A0AB35MEF6_9MICO|nr:long-chain fatty acid--CoA ligase [Demequina sp. SYSU T0a273]MDN4482154.1 long-chain fatty acid--CoA ligase [Demequina sp. SYSU T0a273]
MNQPARADYAPNIVALITDRWRERADQVVMRHADADDRWIDVTGGEALATVAAIAKGLIARGVEPGASVGIMSRTRIEWSLLDVAIWTVGALPVPIYDTSSASQIDWITSDAEIALLFVETAEHAALARQVAEDAESPLSDVMVIDDGCLDDLRAAGAGIPDSLVAERSSLATLDSPATIIYTSGTTGRPKGVTLTHFNFVRHTYGIQDELDDVLLFDGASTVLFLTLAHSLARLVEVALLASGTVIGYCPDARKLVPYFASFQPTLILAVPRVFEKVYNSAEQKAAEGGKVKIFRWAAKQSIDYSRALSTPGGPSLPLKARHAVADRLVLSKIRAVLGGRAIHAISGSAPLGERLGHFYNGLGLQVLEGYGLTEVTAASHVNRTRLSKIGSVGSPLPGFEVRIADDGEILMRGDMLFAGYHRNPEATAAAMQDGWFHTGDIGHQDDEGYLYITGRKKEIIVTAGGKNVAPAVLEDRLRSYALISQCVVVGDAKPYIGALVTLDAEALPAWLKGHGLPEMTVAEAAQDPTVREHLEKAVERANGAVSRAESIRRWEILLDDFTVDNGYLTPSLKMKRSLVLRDFADQIEALYRG